MAKTVNQILKQWNLHKKMVLASTHIDINEDLQSRQLRIEELEADPEKWFSYYFPKYAFAPAAGFHLAATNRILGRPEWYEVRMWSRELGKSTRALMEVLFMMLAGIAERTENDGECKTVARTKKRYLLLVSNSEDNATRLIAPYRANLEYNQRIIQDYGAQENMGTWQAAEFITQQGAAFRALGAGQSPRGTRNEEARPDILLFDDTDTDADCLNPEIIARKWRWIEEAVIGTRSISAATTILFCGNRIAKDCCIERASQYADFVDQVNIRDQDGCSVWPEKNSEKQIDRILKQKSYASQQKEYFNNPLTEGAVFAQMFYKPVREIGAYDILVCYTDPSYKATNDYKATVLVGRKDAEYHVIKCFVALATTAEMIQWHYEIMKLTKGSNCYYYMEEVFMQDVIRKEVSEAGAKKGVTIPLSGDTRRKPDKFMRIETLLEPLNRNGQLYLNAAERHNPHMKLLEEQFKTFAPGSRAHDDGPDAVEGAIWKINDHFGNKNSAKLITWQERNNEKRY